jgi:hypothetical protein
MWLSDRDERKLLRIYYDRVRELWLPEGISPLKPYSIPFLNLVNLFRPEASLDLAQVGAALDLELKPDLASIQTDNDYKRYLDCLAHIFALNHLLVDRGLITLPKGQELSYNDDLFFSLTTTGYDLGFKYSKRWSCWHLWWLEYKDSFLWPLITYIIGILTAVVVQLIIMKLSNGTSE